MYQSNVRLFIIAGNIQQFSLWRNNYLQNNPDTNTRDLTYVTSILSLKGIRNPKGYFIGTWYERTDIDNILMELRICGANIDHVRKP